MIADEESRLRDSRIFSNPLLERLTHSNFRINVIVWVGAGLGLLGLAWRTILAEPLTTAAVAIAGGSHVDPAQEKSGW